MSKAPPFSFVPIDARRSMTKPRSSGLTMTIDYGLGVTQIEMLMETAGPYVDIAKIATGTARLHDRDVLMRKLEAYRGHGVKTMIGGQFQEYVYFHMGEGGIPQYLAEVKALGFDMAEVSDNTVPLTDEERRRQLRWVQDAGLEAIGEVGSKTDSITAEEMIRQVELVLDAGAVMAMIEAMELIADGSINHDLVDALKQRLNPATIMLELVHPRVGATLPDIHRLRLRLIDAFGPDANIGNADVTTIFELETVRLRLGSAGPKGAQT